MRLEGSSGDLLAQTLVAQGCVQSDLNDLKHGDCTSSLVPAPVFDHLQSGSFSLYLIGISHAATYVFPSTLLFNQIC